MKSQRYLLILTYTLKMRITIATQEMSKQVHRSLLLSQLKI